MQDGMMVWVVGKYLDTSDTSSRWTWGFVGVFTTEKAAIAACKSSAYFVGPVKLDDTSPKDDPAWPGAYRPFKLRLIASENDEVGSNLDGPCTDEDVREPAPEYIEKLLRETEDFLASVELHRLPPGRLRALCEDAIDYFKERSLSHNR